VINPAYTPEEDQVLLSYTADLDPQDYKSKTRDFTARFKQAALRLPGRAPDALRKRYLRLRRTPSIPEKSDAGQPGTSPPHRFIPEPVFAKAEPINWEDTFIKPPSKERLMARR
jgi:hypothetical protein